MKESIEIARAELINRWVAAFDEAEKFSEIEKQTITFKYAESFSYNLSNFKNGKIKAGCKTTMLPPVDNDSYGKYGFNKDGFLTTAEIFNKGRLSNFGFFKKKGNVVEYIEFSNERKVPSSIQRILHENGHKTLVQSTFANGRNGFYLENGNSLTSSVTAAFNDGHSAICIIEDYRYENGTISTAYGLEILPGIGERSYENVFSYSNNKLARIEKYYETGQTAAVYIAPSGKTPTKIINELAILFCGYLISVLKKQHFDSPLFSVELGYKYCSEYHPYLVVITEHQKHTSIEQKNEHLFQEGTFIETINDIPKELSELNQEFYQLLQKTDNWEAGKKMLKKTARLMATNKLNREIPVAKDFIVFPIEWEFEWDELENILLQCGASKSTVSELKKYGWI